MSEQTDSTISTTLNTHKAPVPLTQKQREAKQQKFLNVYSEVGVVKYACKAAGINRSTYKYWRDHDEAFRTRLLEAKEEANDTLEHAAYEQAVTGIYEPIVSMGQPVYEQIPVLDKNGEPELDSRGRPKMKRGKMLMKRVLAPSLLQTLLKANMPEKYKDKQHLEHSGALTIRTEWGGGALDEEEPTGGSTLIQ